MSQSHLPQTTLILSPTYYERFQGAFVREASTFTECCLDDKRERLCATVARVIDDLAILTTPADALAAAEIAIACTQSFRTGRVIYFDEDGKPILA